MCLPKGLGKFKDGFCPKRAVPYWNTEGVYPKTRVGNVDVGIADVAGETVKLAAWQ